MREDMNCQKSSNQPELVFDYVAGSGDQEFERHLNECGDCAKVVAAQREVWESLDRLNTPQVSQDFDARLYARIAQEEAVPAWKQWLNRILHPAVPMAPWKPAVSMAALCAVLAVGLMMRPPKPAADTAQVHGDRVDIEQVANALDELDLLSPAPTRVM
jgi:hypothetical protein